MKHEQRWLNWFKEVARHDDGHCTECGESVRDDEIKGVLIEGNDGCDIRVFMMKFMVCIEIL